MKKQICIISVMLFFMAGVNLSAKIRIDIEPPTVTGTGDDPTVNAQLAALANTFAADLEQNSDLKTLGNQEKLATGFGNAVGYAARSASLDGYQGYDLFAFMYGNSVGIQLPALSASGIDQIGDDIEKDKDADVGVGISNAFNLGLNITLLKNMIGLDALLPNRLYMNIKYFSYSVDMGDYSFETKTFGLGINYQLIDNGGDRFSLFKWSGLSLGTGLLYNKNNIEMTYDMGDYESESITPVAGETFYLGFTPETTFGLDISSYVIPVDISTSARLLWIFNFTVGAGLDFTFGTSEIIAEANSDIDLYQNGTKINPTGAGSATIDAGTTGEPTLANFRLTGGLGICFGPLPVDVSLTWYPVTNGAALNISTGIVW